MSNTVSTVITITTRKQLDIYMNPQRQSLLKAMDIHGIPMTAKQLSQILKISASSVTHHIKRLESLGLVELDHTESIHGIQAKYYRKLPVSVSLGGNREDDLQSERTLFSDYIVSQTWQSFKNHQTQVADKEDITQTGDSMSGILHLKQADAKKLYDMILEFIRTHETTEDGTVPWEYVLVAFPHNKGPETTVSNTAKQEQKEK